MMKKLSFREYLESKETLRKAVEKTPIITTEYVVNKYCSLTIGGNKAERERVPLKPNNKVLIEWEFADIEHPRPVGIRFDGVRNKDPYDENITYWSSKRLQEWLTKNTRRRT